MDAERSLITQEKPKQAAVVLAEKVKLILIKSETGIIRSDNVEVKESY